MLVKEAFRMRLAEGEIGIEIEMEGKNVELIPTPRYWKRTFDGSLRGESVEWVLRGAVHRDEVEHRLDYLTNKINAIKNVTLMPSHRCGVHIHINCQDMECKAVINFAILYLVLEDLIITYCDPVRSGNMFCLRACDADYIIDVLIQARQNGSLRCFNSDALRYAALNLSAIPKHGSLEFRALQTPVDFDVIKTWTKILLAIKDASNLFDNPSDIVEGLSAQGAYQFVRHILGDLVNHLNVLELDDLVMRGVRNVQDIAYVPWSKEREPVRNLGPFDDLLRQPIQRMEPIDGEALDDEEDEEELDEDDFDPDEEDF